MTDATQSFVSLLKPVSLAKPAARRAFRAAARHVRPTRATKAA